jgi:hypothetical protein
MAYRQLIDALHDRLAAAGHDDVRPAFGYMLLALREQPTTERRSRFSSASRGKRRRSSIDEGDSS